MTTTKKDESKGAMSTDEKVALAMTEELAVKDPVPPKTWPRWQYNDKGIGKLFTDPQHASEAPEYHREAPPSPDAA